MNRADWLFLAAILAAFAIVFWALFGTLVYRAITGGWADGKATGSRDD